MAVNTIDSRILPLAWVAILPFFLVHLAPAHSYGQWPLAIGLYERGNWTNALVEFDRLRLEHPEDERIQLFQSLSALRVCQTNAAALAELDSLYNSHADPELRAAAACDLGRHAWESGQNDKAFTYLQYAFLHAAETQLFLRSACSLYLFLKENPDYLDQAPSLRTQLNAAGPLVTKKQLQACRLPSGKTGFSLNPGVWVVLFYRSQISPAIGQRCSLNPSCSEYFLQASRKYGPLGLALYGDRAVREPSLVAAEHQPVEIEGHLKYRDPLSDHDAWLRGDLEP